MESHAALLMLALAIPPGQEEKKSLDKNLELGIPPGCSVSGKEILGAIDDGDLFGKLMAGAMPLDVICGVFPKMHSHKGTLTLTTFDPQSARNFQEKVPVLKEMLLTMFNLWKLCTAAPSSARIEVSYKRDSLAEPLHLATVLNGPSGDIFEWSK